MVKKTYLTILLLLTCLYISSQTTYYYKLIKTEKKGIASTNVSGGQFLSFNEKVCYESDKKGYQVNESRMDYKYTDNDINVYSGKSYWGANTTFFFTVDNEKLSVRTSEGDKYVYERCTPPSDALTCSLIREPLSGGNNNTQPIYPIGVIGGSYGGNSVGISTINDVPTTSSERQQQPQLRTRCPNCTNGRRVYETSYNGYTGGLKQDMKRCSECGKIYDALSITHRHDRCTTCHGTGYLD